MDVVSEFFCSRSEIEKGESVLTYIACGAHRSVASETSRAGSHDDGDGGDGDVRPIDLFYPRGRAVLLSVCK